MKQGSQDDSYKCKMAYLSTWINSDFIKTENEEER